MKTFGKYLIIVLAGCAIGSVALGLDGRGRFIPQRFLLRSLDLRVGSSGWLLPALEKAGALEPVRVEVERGVSLFLDPRDFVSRVILMSGVWQQHVWQSISDGLSTGAVFLDVGAHIGYDSLRGSVRVGESGKVIAFEPNPGTLEQLRANIAASHANNMLVEPIACTDKEQMLTLYDATSAGNSGASSLSLANADSAWKKGTLPSVTVRGRPIDNVVRELGLNRVDVVKVDVEGAEYLVLRGMRETLLRFHPKLVMEVVPSELANMNATVEDLFSLVKELGYGPGKEVDDGDWEWTVK